MNEENYNPTRVTLLAKLKKEGNDEAWLEFEDIYRGFILSLILRMGINRADAEDISQAVLTKVWQKIEGFEYNQNKGYNSAAANFFKLSLSTNVYEFVEHRYARLELELMRIKKVIP